MGLTDENPQSADVLRPGEPNRATLSRFFAGLAHDLRTPLTVIRNSVHFLRRSAEKNPEIAEYLDLIESETKELNAVLDHLNEVTHGRDPKHLEVDLESIISEAVSHVDVNKHVNWKIELEFKPATIWADRNQMLQVFRNIMRNAVAATKGRGEVVIRAWREPDFDLIELHDNGPGVPTDVRKTLFDPLVSTRPTGMGLGLTYCREVLRRHGGRIELTDATPGAAFRIAVPRHRSDPN